MVLPGVFKAALRLHTVLLHISCGASSKLISRCSIENDLLIGQMYR
jgi:hypothetical protein